MKTPDHVDRRALLREWRNGIGLSQARMADLMGVPSRTYEDLEAGKAAVRPVHINAAALALIEHAAQGGGYDSLPAELGDLVRKAAG